MRELIDKLKFAIQRNPIFSVLILILIFESIMRTQGNIFDWLYDKIIILPGIIIGITCHEFAHAFASYKLGDPTPKYQNRLNFNPISHFSGLGFICLILLGFGWGRPVEINPNYYKKRRRDEFIVAIAGVATNLLIAFILAFVWKFTVGQFYASGNVNNGIEILSDVIVQAIAINVILMAFNLMPIPPLDGFNALTQIFNLQRYEWWYKFYNYGQWIMVFIIAFNMQSYFVMPIYRATMKYIYLIMS